MPGFGVKKPVALTAGILPNLETAACSLSAPKCSQVKNYLFQFAAAIGCKLISQFRALKAAFDFGDAGGQVLDVRVVVTPVLSPLGCTLLNPLRQPLTPHALRHSGVFRGLKTCCANGFYVLIPKTAYLGRT